MSHFPRKGDRDLQQHIEFVLILFELYCYNGPYINHGTNGKIKKSQQIKEFKLI